MVKSANGCWVYSISIFESWIAPPEPISHLTNLKLHLVGRFSRVIEQSPGCEESSSPFGWRRTILPFSAPATNVPKFAKIPVVERISFWHIVTVPFSIEFEYPILFWFNCYLLKYLAQSSALIFISALPLSRLYFASPHFWSFLAFSIFQAKVHLFRPIHWPTLITSAVETTLFSISVNRFERFWHSFSVCQFPRRLGRLMVLCWSCWGGWIVCLGWFVLFSAGLISAIFPSLTTIVVPSFCRYSPSSELQHRQPLERLNLC